MTPDEAEGAIRDTLGEIAPDADLQALAPDADLREEIGLDSLDFLNFVEALGQRTGLRIDEDDYPRIATLADGTEFLANRLRTQR